MNQPPLKTRGPADLPPYEAIPGFEPLIAIEYGFLLALYFENKCLSFKVEAILHTSHPDYQPPPPNVWTCLATRWLCFPHVEELQWVELIIEPEYEEGTIYLGENHAFWPEFGAYHLIGEWGEAHIKSDTPIVLRTAKEFLQFRQKARE